MAAGDLLGQAPSAAAPNARVRIVRPNAPAPDDLIVRGIHKEVIGSVYHLRGKAELETTEGLLTADEMDYDEATGYAEARGNVHYKNFDSGEELYCNRAEYNVIEERGKFYEVSGTLPAAIEARPGVLTSDNPFTFQGKWAERIESRYILHDGMVTSCKMPKPWWTLTGPKFDLIPNRRAIAHRSLFRLRGIPLFYAPYFYKSLEKQPRRSGFLMPNFGNSSRRGFMFGIGYYWAISRSFDLTYRPQYFSRRGIAHLADFRGKPTRGSDFDLLFYGVNDKGLENPDGTRTKQGGISITFRGKAQLPKGWSAFAQINYLSSFRFRQAFAETFNEAVFSEVTSTAYATKHWNGYGINAVFDRIELFQSNTDDSRISIRKLPQLEFFSQDRRVKRSIPVWWSFGSSASLMRRNQPQFQTRQAMERFDFAPRLMSVLRWKQLELVPSISTRQTYWGSTFSPPDTTFDSPFVSGQGMWRNSFQGDVELILPSLARVFNTSGWLGEKMKHVIEPRANFRYVGGVSDFHSIIRFDDTELVNNTNELEVSITNRFYIKRGTEVREWATWEVWHRRYFDPDFGGAVTPGRRNVLMSTADFSGYAFLDRPRHYSPYASNFRIEPVPGFGVSWRSDYDPLRGAITNNTIAADGRHGELFLQVGHNQIRSSPDLSSPGNQFRGTIGWGRENRRGWSTAFSTFYDYRLGRLSFANTQVTYNTDCCGFSFQFRRFPVAGGFDNQYRVALAIANVGSFGTLRRQERFF